MSSSTVAELTRLKNLVFRLSLPFRENQLEAMVAAAHNENIFYVASTGQGKSLVYQLPSLLDKSFHLPPCASNLTLVISPLKSLINDQLHHLGQIPEIKCAALHGDIPLSSQLHTLQHIQTFNLLFLTPERLALSQPEETNEFTNTSAVLLEKLRAGVARPRRIVFDEAHCILQWGHTFRPKYLEAVQTCEKLFPDIPITMVSTTAPPQVRHDLAKLLLRDWKVFVQDDMNRTNLEFHIRKKPENLFPVLADMLKTCSCAIVFCVTKDQVDSLSEFLSTQFGKLKVQRYHSGMTAKQKSSAFSLWKSGLSPIMIATNAFGLGVNFAKVRLVVHASMPLTFTDYIQQCGRAGRDGKPSTCVLFYNLVGDVKQAREMVKEYDHPEELDEMISFCTSRECARNLIEAKLKGSGELTHVPFCQDKCACRE